MIEDFEEPLAEIRRIQTEHPNDAYHQLSRSRLSSGRDPLGRLYLAMLALVTRSKIFGSVDAVPMLSKVARGSERDETLERVVRLYALVAWAKLQPEDASELAPWVAEVLSEAAKEMQGALDRERILQLDNSIAEYDGPRLVANTALDALSAMGAGAAPAAPVLEEIVAGPPLWSSSAKEWDLRDNAQEILDRMVKRGISSVKLDDQRGEKPEKRSKKKSRRNK